MVFLYVQWEHTYGNLVSGMMNSFPTTIRQEMVRNLYTDMFAKVCTVPIVWLVPVATHMNKQT